MDKLKVLFVCSRNAGRSQMAEAFLRRFAGDAFEVESAGLDPAPEVLPLVRQVMAEEGLDLSGKKPQSVFDLFRQGRLYDYVIAVCDTATAESCPVFPGVTQRWRWPFPDPEAVAGTPEERLAKVRAIRDMVREKVERPFSEQTEA
ncbi:protein tyrosine phosphatase [Humidesulfovibrio mexicanus]|jgi:arsenate reductase|uniref:Protein tyrosine phosphatase n=1 Tax=Humidesulfovibrio mexicanus TaxID=147047 RepID=A0A239ARA8_9BACT|nr:arsenate reductase ArsC [Humidesulfovibrio mexicanus]SNR98236.1 protein tyrosine phosphatase [Humidesulfovibrio mexicanus]